MLIYVQWLKVWLDGQEFGEHNLKIGGSGIWHILTIEYFPEIQKELLTHATS